MFFLIFVQLPLLALLLLVAVGYIRHWQRSGYWEKRGIPCLKGSVFPLGVSPLVSFETMLGKKHSTDLALEQYEVHKDKPYYGVYSFLNKPMVVINDPALIRSILVKNFANFINRAPPSPPLPSDAKSRVDKAFARNLTALADEDWKLLRSKVSPVFTTSKLKFMHELMKATTGALVADVDRHFAADEDVDIKSACSKLSMDTIASCAFGLETKSFESRDEPTKFMTCAKQLFRVDLNQTMKSLFLLSKEGYKVLEWLGLSLLPSDAEYLVHTIEDSIQKRASGEIQSRNDLIDLMIKALQDEGSKFDVLDLVGSCLAILIAGFEAASNTLICTLYELAQNEECQERLFEEIQNASQNGLDYNALMELNYLDQVINESMRLHSTVPILARYCNKDLRIDDKLTITEGMTVLIPEAAIHQDPAYWEHANKFNPDHFSADSVKSRNPYVFMPFGHGPRNCIGMRFALLELKMAIVALIKKYKLIPGKNMPPKLTSDPGNTTNWPKEDIFLKFELRAKENA